jgi:hypothetical protein
MPHWEITPHHDEAEADSTIMPAETDADHHAALDYAKERLESLWDQADHDKTVTVTMTLRSAPMPEPPPSS